MITVTVSGKSDAAVAGALDALAAEVPKALAELQNTAGVPDEARISVLTLTKDTTSTVLQKGRIEVVGMIGAAGLVLTVLLVGLVDGLVRGRRQRAAQPPQDGPQTDGSREPRRAAKPKRKAGAVEPEPVTSASVPGDAEAHADVGAEVEAEVDAEPAPAAASRTDEPHDSAGDRAGDGARDSARDSAGDDAPDAAPDDADDIDWDAFFAETGHRSVGESRDR
jgi:hypothetical protein